MNKNDKNIETNIETTSKDGTRRGQNKNSRNNLVVPKKGTTPNPNGRPQGVLDIRQRVEIAIDYLAEKYVLSHNAEPKNVDNQIERKDVDIMGDVFSQLVNQARNGNIKAMDSLMDRVYGKAKQTVEMTGKNGDPIQHEIRIKEAREKALATFKKWNKPIVEVSESATEIDVAIKITKAKKETETAKVEKLEIEGKTYARKPQRR